MVHAWRECRNSHTDSLLMKRIYEWVSDTLYGWNPWRLRANLATCYAHIGHQASMLALVGFDLRMEGRKAEQSVDKALEIVIEMAEAEIDFDKRWRD